MAYTFAEFIAARDSESFDNIDPSWLKWAKEQFLPEYQKIFTEGKHEGDCTKQAFTCSLCCLSCANGRY